MKWAVEFSRKSGTMNPAQAIRTRRIEVTAKDKDEARSLAVVEAKRTGVSRYFEIIGVRKV